MKSSKRTSPGWTGGKVFIGIASLVIIDNLNISGSALRPGKANAPLIIDTNTVLPGMIAMQFFQSSAEWRE
jgi:hypothetical protein